MRGNRRWILTPSSDVAARQALFGDLYKLLILHLAQLWKKSGHRF